MRSLLFVPGDSERKLMKCGQSGADVLIIDLEDSVALEKKPVARDCVARFMQSERKTFDARVFVRINALDTGMSDDDLASAMAWRPDGIMLPKSNSAEDITHLSAKLNVHEAENDINEGVTAILPIITETAIGALSTGTYGGENRRLVGVTWGAEDLSAEVGARSIRDDNGDYTDVFRFARAMTILAGSAAGVASIDTVFVDFRDQDRLRRECVAAERDGFTGKLAIHPDQVAIINAAFTPSPQALAEAGAIIEAFAAAGNPGVVAVDGKMYDRPHLKRAERLLARANSPEMAQ